MLGSSKFRRVMSEPSRVDLKRSLLVQIMEGNRLESTLTSAEQIDSMSDEEVERVTNLLMEMVADMNNLYERIWAMSNDPADGGDSINN
jgi:hypothetical protein